MSDIKVYGEHEPKTLPLQVRVEVALGVEP